MGICAKLKLEGSKEATRMLCGPTKLPLRGLPQPRAHVELLEYCHLFSYSLEFAHQKDWTFGNYGHIMFAFLHSEPSASLSLKLCKILSTEGN